VQAVLSNAGKPTAPNSLHYTAIDKKDKLSQTSYIFISNRE